MVVIFFDWLYTNYYSTNLRLIEEKAASTRGS
jgi:hypothetical protein